ncbi:glycine oxidase ThiO [Nodosilinea sp. P-1105]|uniref:glycine oxidase ThiO n=1 Tax=Nodosilinea sp. P-1105 TaxID=2546229 RepID=UPI00146DB1F6|nr:glycine oxidase ThiO [Nodosilinea sp. P-1105]NMF85860.1 glycine oxidase ThiO [Nodosilinea sp. P-1105]
MTQQGTDVLIVGGGIIGLAIALELRQQGATVTILSKDFAAAASHAAAGMLAPRAEGLSPGPMLDLCLASLALYPDWVAKLEALTGQSVGYWPCGILAPRQHPPADWSTASGQWLNAETLGWYQPGLGDHVVGADWYPEEGQVNNQALVQALRSAVTDLGVTLYEGVGATAIRQHQGRIERVCTAQAGDFAADHVVLATGAWSHDLLPLPVFPTKGEMASLRVPPGYGTLQPLQRVIFGADTYIVPRQDGRIILGATSQNVGFTPGNTARGVHHLLARATALLPLLADFCLEQTWWGYRPATPDQWPILGPGPARNLTLATGHYRNGILLTPMTARLIAQSVLHGPDQQLAPFSWQRFHHPPTAAPVPPTAYPTVPSLTTPPMTLTHSTAIAAANADATRVDPGLTIAGRGFKSRLMTGTGKYSNFEIMRESIAASGCEIVTVAVRRVQTAAPGHEGLAEALDWSQLWMLPNTAGCKTAGEAIRVARLGREMAKLLGQEDNNFVKLEVIPDTKYLLPDPIGTLEAAEQLVKEGFVVLPYINADPLLAKRLEEVGCATVMPLGSPIGSGQGIRNSANIQIIIENASVPVVVDAGIGTPSEAAAAMEMGADALLINTAIAKAADPIAMGRAMGLATTAGRLAYRAGRIPVQGVASASSPLTGRVTESSS